jgi:4-carboxymuconolactone decarboxylase
VKLVALIVALNAGVGVAFAQSTAPSTDAISAFGELPRGTLAIELHSPPIAAALDRIDTYLRAESTLEPRLLELLSLVAARELSSAYQWSAHHRAALQAGLEPSVIEIVRLSQPVAGLASFDALVIDFGRQLFRTRHVDSGTFAALLERRGRRGTFDVIMALTYPTLTAMLQRAADQQPPAGWNLAALPALPEVGTPNGNPGEFVALPPRPPLPPDVLEDSYYRLPLLRRDELEQRAREIFDRVVGPGRATTPRGPVGMSFNSPELVEPIQALNTALRVDGVLGTRLAELVIAATGREMNSQYQWTVHGAAAERAGAGQAVLDAIRLDGSLAGLDARDAAAIALTRELFRNERVEPATFAAAAELFGTRGALEIAALAGDYLMMTMVYNALGMRLGPDQPATLPHRAGAPIGAEWR